MNGVTALGGVVGREAVLGALRAFLGSGDRRAFVLAGEPGIGKTTIVRAALDEATAQRLRVFHARPTAGEAELPYVGLGDLLSTVRAESVETLAPPQRAAIRAALGREGSSGSVDEYALSRGLLELLRLEGAAGDLVLSVDDVQWLDRPTTSALTFALRRLGQVPVRVLVAVRRENGPAPEAPFALDEWPDTQQVEVGPLSATELGLLLRDRLGESFSRPRLEELHRNAGGNPMFALELARATGPPASTLPRALEERLRSLDARPRRALSFAAAALAPSITLLRESGVDREEIRAALGTEILLADGERLSFAHPLLGAAVYGALLPDELREIHESLAAASSDPVERGHHVSRSAVHPARAAAEALDAAAEASAGFGDHAGAATFLLRAAELSDDEAAAQLRELGASVELELAGDVEAAAAVARRLVDHLPPGVVRARAWLMLANCTLGSWLTLDEALAGLDLALEEAGDDAGVQAQVHLAISEFCSGACKLEAALSHARSAISLARQVGANDSALTALAQVGFVECMLGKGVTRAAREAHERSDPAFLSPNTIYSPRLALGCAFLYTSALDEAEELFQQELAMAEERGFEPVEVMARALLAESQLRGGRWAEGFANARQTLEHARQAAAAQIVTGVSYSMAMSQALLGQHEPARALAGEALANAEADGDFWFRIYHRGVLGLIALAEDDAQAAVDVLEPAWALMLDEGLGEFSIFPVAHVLGEALVTVGRGEDAAALAGALRSSPAGERAWCRAMAGRIEALVASANGEHDSARALVAVSLAAHADLPEPFELARTLQVRGRIERNARRWGAARRALGDALERFDTLGAARWAEKAAADLARLPGRRPADGEVLTARERDVAELVGSGLSNKEVAARLHVSVRTVEANLSKVYAKLGVRSRTELASRVRA